MDCRGILTRQLGITKPKVFALRHYKLAGFSMERLTNLSTILDLEFTFSGGNKLYFGPSQ